jgi:hypothetical protein
LGSGRVQPFAGVKLIPIIMTKNTWTAVWEHVRVVGKPEFAPD